MALFPSDSAERKKYPIYSGFLQYFPSAVALVARHSYEGNEKHNPGKPLQHDRSKSGDELDALCRHLVEHGPPDLEGELVAVAWRAMSALQKYAESQGAPIAPAATNFVPPLPPSPSMTDVLMGIPPNVRAMIDRGNDDPAADALTAGTASDPAGYARATAAQRETGE